jgi:hypothetical protein
MAIGGASFIAGSYSSAITLPGNYLVADLGIMESGYEISITYAKQVVGKTDRFGDSVVDTIERGISNCFLNMKALEYKVGTVQALTMHQNQFAGSPAGAMTPTGNSYLEMGRVGYLGTSIAANVLVTNASPGSTAAITPISVLFPLAALRENQDLRFGLDSALRELPLSFRIFPFEHSVSPFGNLYQYFTTS